MFISHKLFGFNARDKRRRRFERFAVAIQQVFASRTEVWWYYLTLVGYHARWVSVRFEMVGVDQERFVFRRGFGDGFVEDFKLLQ